MKKKLTLLFTLMMGLMLLVACSSDDGSSSGAAKSPKKAKEGLNTISYDQLMKKLEDRDTFYLVSLDARPELIKEKNVESDFDEEFKNRGMKVFFVNLYGVDDSKKQSLSKDYLHTVMSTGSGYTWDASSQGFVYVENGRIINLAGGVNFEEEVIESYDSMKKSLTRKLDSQFQRMKENGISPKVD